MNTVTLTGRIADRDHWSAGGCSIASTLDRIGRRASVLLLREAFYGAHRFEEFVNRAGFTEAVTATRLRELVEDGVLEKRPYKEPGQRQRDEYHLTEKGADLFPVLLALARWGDKWSQPDGGPIAFTHAGCGGQVEVEVRCAHGHDVTLAEIEASARHPQRRTASA